MEKTNAEIAVWNHKKLKHDVNTKLISSLDYLGTII